MARFKMIRSRKQRNQSVVPNEEESSTETYTVDFIYGKKLDEREGNIKYRVKWEGYDYGESTWEPIMNLSNVSYMISNFEEYYSRVIFTKKLKKPDLSKKKVLGTKRKFEPNFEEIEMEFKKNLTRSKRETKSKEFTFSDLLKQNPKEIPQKENGAKNQKTQPLPQVELQEDEFYKNYGNIDKDKPSKVLNHKVEQPILRITDAYYKIEFEKRTNGAEPKPSYFPYSKLKNVCPKLLLDYLEAKCRLLN